MVRRLVQVSDLHFGALRAETVEPLLRHLRSLCPDVFVVSGDLTQRATRAQFVSAREFLERVPCHRQVVVPGNHDVPLWNVWKRFGEPRQRFDKHISGEPFPTAIDEELAVVGVNTARSWAISNGRINARQLMEVARRFREAPPGALRVLTCHHPFVLPEGTPAKERARRSDMALGSLVEYQVDMLLTGHRHVPWVSNLGTAIPTVHGGTTTSSRTRGVENSFNELLVDSTEVTVRRFSWRPSLKDFLVDEPSTRVFSRDAVGRLTPSLPAPQSVRSL